MGACRTCLIFITIHLISVATAQEMEKRVPQGFLGMRGKKYIGLDSTEQFYKRKPQFFPSKDKKSLQEILESGEEFYKRAPMGFMGMRGKKEAPFPDPERGEYVPKRDGSWMPRIDDISGVKLIYPDNYLLNELLSKYLQKYKLPKSTSIETETDHENDDTSNEIEKRAANIHQFFGVRGKKLFSIYNRPDIRSTRGKFIGVRGKRDNDMKNNGIHEIKFLLDSPLPKRKSQMGFFGMRGKKWLDVDESSLEMEMPN